MADDKKVFYANSVNFSVSLYDFMMDFGVRTPTNEKDKEPEHETVAIVAMSPQHAKVMAQIIGDNVRKYEEAHGEIKIPPQILGNRH